MYMGGLVLENIAFTGTTAAIVMSVQLKLKEHEIKVDLNGLVLPRITAMFGLEIRCSKEC